MECPTVLHFSLFCSNIQVLMYDIRAQKPYHVQDHHYGLPINSVAFHSGQGLVLSTDTKALKIWSRDKVGSPRLSHTCGGLHGVTSLKPYLPWSSWAPLLVCLTASMHGLTGLLQVIPFNICILTASLFVNTRTHTELWQFLHACN